MERSINLPGTFTMSALGDVSKGDYWEVPRNVPGAFRFYKQRIVSNSAERWRHCLVLIVL